MRILNPFTYLLFPFSIENGTDLQFLNSSTLWTKGKVITNNTDDKYRKGVAYSYIRDYFQSFIGNQSDDKVSSIIIMSLDDTEKQYDSWLEECLCFRNPKNGKIIEFGICYKQNSFDTIKLLVNSAAGIGLLLIPISVRANIDDFRDFIYYIRQTAQSSIWKKGEKENQEWNLNSIVKSLLIEFEGHYSRFNNELALHLSFLVFDGKKIDETIKSTIISMTRGDLKDVTNEKNRLGQIETSNDLYIASSIEGTVILTLANWGNTKETEKETVLRYRIEQTERYMIYLLIVMQRYSLIKIVQELSRIRGLLNASNRNALEGLREKARDVSLIRLENYFSIISDFSVYNEFYQICSSSYGIDKLYSEIEQKMSVLNSYLTQQSDERRESAEWKLAIIAAILTVFSATNDISQLLKGGIEQPWLFFIVISFFIVIAAFLFNTIIKNLRN